jgi:hypothetical protein
MVKNQRNFLFGLDDLLFVGIGVVVGNAIFGSKNKEDDNGGRDYSDDDSVSSDYDDGYRSDRSGMTAGNGGYGAS